MKQPENKIEIIAPTSGPWMLQGPKTQKDFDNQTYWTILPDPRKSKADPYKCVGFFYPYSGHTPEQQKANAELIAVAPVLLSENKRLQAEVDKLKLVLSKLTSDLQKLIDSVKP